MKNLELSKALYADLITGKYINKDKLNSEDTLVQNELFVELEKNQDEYFKFYNEIGYILMYETDYFYLIKEDEKKEDDESFIDKNILKEYVLMIVLYRYLLDNKISIDRTLLDNNFGLSKEQIEPMFNDLKYSNVLMLSEMKNLTVNLISEVLEKRNILMKNSKGNFVLSEIGKSFLTYMEREGTLVLGEIEK